MAPYKSATAALVPAAFVRRGAGLDAAHAAAIAVVDGSSRLTHALGDVEQAFFARSTIKPLQALPLVRAGGLARFGFGPEQLALCAASHNGSDLHRELVRGMLQRLGLGAEALKCGADYPMQLKLFGQYPLAGEDRDPLRHNCSGKHSGFLALARLLEQPLATYLEPEGPVQVQVRRAVAELAEVSVESLQLGTDGCSAPNFTLPLRSMAVAFKNLARGEDDAVSQVRAAMLAHPLLVSGERRLDYALSLAFPGRILVKGGAEALLLLSFREPALGIAIKVVDGGSRALGPLAVETLRQLGLLDDLARYPTLVEHARPVVKNGSGLSVGEIFADFQLEPQPAA